MSSSEGSLFDDLASITSGSIKSREAGIKSLITLLDPRPRSTGKSSSPLDGLSDKHYHRIFEALFSCAVIEQRSGGGASAGRSAAASKARLSRISEALRLALHHGSSKLKRKTVRAVIDHITQSDGPFLLQDHLKSLITLLTANVEQLAASKDAHDWFSCFDFCLEKLAGLLEADGESLLSNESAYHTDPGIRAESSIRASPAPSIASNIGRSGGLNGRGLGTHATSTNRTIIQDLLHCIHLLVLPPNAPVRNRAQILADALVKVLRLPYAISSITLYGFSCLNILFERIQADDVTLAKNLAQEAVPLVRQWWERRTVANDGMQNSVRDEMLKVILNIHLHLEEMASTPENTVLAEIEQLAEALWLEYARRQERNQLQLHDITFTTSILPTDHFQTRTFGLRPHHIEGERKWALMLNLALLEHILWQRDDAHATAAEGPLDEDLPRKRRRKTNKSIRLRDKLASSDTSQAALRLLPFLADLGVDLADLRSELATQVSGGTPWAMVAYASLITSEGLDDTWKMTWPLAVRAMDHPDTCRAASFLLKVMLDSGHIPYQSIANDISSIVTAAEVNGPKVLVDSSIQLMAQIQAIRNAKLPNASQETSLHIIQWALARWRPVQPRHEPNYSLYIHPTELANLLLKCCGAKQMELHPTPTTGSTISHAWSQHLNSTTAIRYLLLLPETTTRVSRTKPLPKAESAIETGSFVSSRTLILELLFLKLGQLDELCRSWTKKSSEGGTRVSSEKLQNLLSACAVSAALAPHLANCNTRQSKDIEPLILGLMESTLSTICAASDKKELFQIVLQEMALHIPPINTANLQSLADNGGLVLHLVVSVAGSLRQSAEKEASYRSNDADSDDDFGSQERLINATAKPVEMPRQNTPMRLNPEAFAHATTARIYFLEALQATPGATLVPSSFIDFACGLPSETLLFSGDALTEIISSDFSIRSEDAQQIVEKIGSLVGETRLASCEVAQSTVLNMMDGLMQAWLDSKSDIYTSVQDLYHYFVEQSLPQNALSPQSQNTLASLLFQLLLLEPGYGTDAGLASSRTTLLLIMQQSPMVVKYSIAIRLPEIFGLFILKKHDEVFVDILQSLPTDPSMVEGIAFRLLVLSEVACRWPTLLRRSTYHIFETAGKVTSSTEYATRCLAHVSKTLRLASPKDLFALFRPQLLYTWLEEESIDDMPFKIFGFDSLRQMLETSQAEASALMLMRLEDDKARSLATLLSTTYTEMIRKSFAKIVAYAIAQDTNMSSSRQGQTSAENRVRKQLGNEPYIDGIYANFADIVAIMFDSFDQETAIEKYFAQDDKFAYAASIMTEINGYAHSDVRLASNQQPVFKAKYLLRQLFHLCNRTEHELSTLWTPALVVSVARRLFNSIHPALGSLHACSALRKVRVLICLAGPAALTQYPTEMLLHSIRPLIVDSECADDALGISRYLITNSSQYLKYAPSFLAGYGLSTLASLRVFLESSQSSTTQESQFKATISKAQSFHAWLSDYLNKFESPYFADEAQQASFKVITRTASNIRSSGNAERGSNESKLLLEVLRDEKREKRLLNEPARELALGLLCGDFVVPASIQHDVLNTDDGAAELGGMVWTSCKAGTLSNEYLAWAGRVMGRSFAATGELEADFLQESTLTKSLELAPSDHTSGEGLIRLLQRLTYNKDSFTSGLAESALRAVVSEANALEDKQLIAAAQTALHEPLFAASAWQPYQAPPSDIGPFESNHELHLFSGVWIERTSWVQDLAAYLSQTSSDDILLTHLRRVVLHDKAFAEEALPFIVHLALSNQLEKQQTVKRQLSDAVKTWLEFETEAAKANQRHLINAMLYLRTQALPRENSIADRSQWLDVDYGSIGSASSRCGMPKTALLFTEIAASQLTRVSRRTSAAREEDNTEALLQIYESIDDPDAYYGILQPASLDEVLARAEHENDGSKILAFRGASYTGHLSRRDPAAQSDAMSLVGALGILGLPGLAHTTIGSLDNAEKGDSKSLQHTFDLARRLQMWNLPAPAESENHAVTLYKALQKIQQVQDITAVRHAIYNGYTETMRTLAGSLTPASLRGHLGALAALTELDDAVNVADFGELGDLLQRFEQRSQWMRRGRYLDVRSLLSCRETTFTLMSQHESLRGVLSTAQAKQTEISCKLISSGIYRYHRATNECLNLWAEPNLIARCETLGLNVEATVQFELASSMWDHGETKSSILMLRALDSQPLLKKQSIPVSRSALLSKIGHQVSAARLEKPHDIQNNYLTPALKELKGNTKGKEAGQVFHQFAMFCDDQLQNQDALEDLARLRKLRKGKSEEVSQLKNLLASAKTTELTNRYKSHLIKAKSWLDLDDQELRRLEQTRAEFVRLSLENYLLSLSASDEFNNDALRFTALWLERADDESTNDAVRKYLDAVPTRKFAMLMNQLSSRLQDRQGNSFQALLMGLVRSICIDHPYHGMYHIWSSAKVKLNNQDDVAMRRQKAAERLSKDFERNEKVGELWHSIDRSSGYYHRLAGEKNDKFKAGQKFALKDSTAAYQLIHALAKYKIPPPTMQIELDANCDYSRVPIVARLEPQMTIASGVSAPKIITVVGTDGKKYRQLVKGGNDDLRQDAIMEQVFAAVSALLARNRETQRRNLGIRTYKVLPLTAISGLIEFVPNTIPLHEFLMPAHERYHPKDLKGSQCRKEISNVQGKSSEQRIATYRKVKEKFQPVMKYFFLEYFVDPDEWFAKRTAYTRTTAAISMLGHVLGLGDRHGHNILLDHETGEVVHIDLGVAFEMGRVLPVPELVPFRLTRDIVDGMGLTKTEGVFRRCCEFTLDALREEQYSIMTILDVLRYDPLYSWSISPVRLAKLQGQGQQGDPGLSKGPVDEASEADRALEVVRKKLSKTLSVEATVNDLINQATDERNLALLYSGWAAYA
ncbi:ataxia telangiectasia mutated [Plectosphaerella plurivora]|uniref:Serine/threonine-protein kinase Tel1 n=1 Tax=Plectosphaerella plurivora TaxID=936078 RepID=A0A9P8VJM5_9PEZI|nr:ataxia telangiectasia mutated [Plectosphaerella plurivora]